jgi:hypothetical protein
LWRGDRAARNAPHARNARLEPVFEALRAHGLYAEAAVYSEEWIEEIRSQLTAVDAVLVLKRNRGNGGQGIWKAERIAIADATDTIRVVEACRGSVGLRDNGGLNVEVRIPRTNHARQWHA